MSSHKQLKDLAHKGAEFLVALAAFLETAADEPAKVEEKPKAAEPAKPPPAAKPPPPAKCAETSKDPITGEVRICKAAGEHTAHDFGKAAEAKPKDLLKEAKAAAVKYAEKHGREQLRAVVDKYTKESVADVPADKLPELIAELSAAA